MRTGSNWEIIEIRDCYIQLKAIALWSVHLHLGQGYFQQIELREDLTLEIWDCTLERDLVIEVVNQTNLLKFEFQLRGADAGYSIFFP